MNKFNLPTRNIARERRAKRAERRRLQSGNASLKVTPQKTHTSVSGKKQRKLKKWRKAQQRALDSGLVTMQDIEMMAADGEGESSDPSKSKTKKNKRVFAVKKRAKLRLKQTAALKGKAKVNQSTAEVGGDAMMQ